MVSCTKLQSERLGVVTVPRGLIGKRIQGEHWVCLDTFGATLFNFLKVDCKSPVLDEPVKVQAEMLLQMVENDVDRAIHALLAQLDFIEVLPDDHRAMLAKLNAVGRVIEFLERLAIVEYLALPTAADAIDRPSTAAGESLTASNHRHVLRLAERCELEPHAVLAERVDGTM